MGKERRTGHQNQLSAAQLVAFRLDQRLTVKSKSNARMRMETQVRRTAQWHPFIAPVREGGHAEYREVCNDCITGGGFGPGKTETPEGDDSFGGGDLDGISSF